MVYLCYVSLELMAAICHSRLSECYVLLCAFVPLQRAMARSGIGMVTPAVGLGALAALLTTGATTPAVTAAIPFRWGRFMRQPRNRALPLFEEFALPEPTTQPAPAAAVPAVGHPAVAAAPAEPPAAAVPSLADVLSVVLAAVAAVNGEGVGEDQPLVQAGLDSLGESLAALFLGQPSSKPRALLIHF